MKVSVEKRTVVGTLKTLCGTYSLLDEFPESVYSIPSKPLREIGALVFDVVDDEGFQNFIYVLGDFIVIPAKVPTQMDVKHVVTDKEEDVELITAETID